MTVVSKAFLRIYWDNYIEKSYGHKYIRKIPNSKGGFNYIYPKDFSRPVKALLSFFGMKEEKIDTAYTNNNINEAYGVTKQGFAAHLLEYLSNRQTWNKFFSDKFNRDRYKVPEKQQKKEVPEKVVKESEIKNNGKVTDTTNKQHNKTTERNFKSKWNNSLMRKIYSMYNPIPEDKKVESSTDQKTGDKVSFNGNVGKIVKDYGNGLVYVNFDNGGMGRFKKEDLQLLNPTNDDITEEAEINAVEQQHEGTEPEQKIIQENTETVTEETESPEEEHENRSQAMLGNDNAKKDIYTEEQPEDKEKELAETAEFKELLSKYNELRKEYKANGGMSYRHNTPEQEVKRRAARKELNEVERKMGELKEMVDQSAKGYKLHQMYKEPMNEFLKRKVKGQTVSFEWVDKKFGSRSSSVPIAQNVFISIDEDKDINNPSVYILFTPKGWGSPTRVSLNINKMVEGKYYIDGYTGNFYPEDVEYIQDKGREMQKILENTPGNTPAEKFYNMILGEDNEYSKSVGNTDVPRYRFTKDGIKDKTGKLNKISASIRDVGTDREYIRLYADDYGQSIPSIFYPENNTDMMTDYFEKDSSDVFPDHPYYNHLKIMALKDDLYRGRSTKWAAMTPEQQKEVEKQIKELEKELVEPTEEELQNYRKKRDSQEEAKETWENARRKTIEKKREESEQKKKEENAKKFIEAIQKLAEAIEKEPPVNLDGLTKQQKIDTLEKRIFKLDVEIKNLNDAETVESKKQFRNILLQKLDEVRNEPDEETGIYTIKDSNGNSITNKDAINRIRENFNYVDEGITNLTTQLNTVARKEALKENIRKYLEYSKELLDQLNPDERKEIETEYEKFINRSNAMLGNQNAYKGLSNEELKEEPKNNVEQARENLKNLENQIGQGNGSEFDKKFENARNEVARAEMDEKDSKDGIQTPIPTLDSNVTQRISDNSMSGHGGEVYQHDVNIEMKEFRDKFNVETMNPQQKEYFQERLNSYAGLVGESYGDMARKRLSAGPSWVVAGPAKYNFKKFNKKMDAEMRSYETFKEKKEKFIKNTEKRLKELKYTGGSESVEDVKKKVFEDYSNGKWSYGDKIDNTDPYAIEKISGKIKYMEDAHAVTLLYGKLCKKNGLTNVDWADRTDEEKAKRKEVLSQAVKEAKEKGYSMSVIKQGIEHPFTANQTADIRRNKERLEDLKKRQALIDERNANTTGENNTTSANTGRVDFDGGYIYENVDMDRIQIIYDGKPERDVIDKLKHNGFRWSPSQGAWQRQLNRNGRMAVNTVLRETGIDTKIDIDGAGEVKKSLPKFIIKNGRFFIKKSLNR